MTTQSVAVRGQPGAPAGYPRRWLAAIVMIVGALMDMIDVTIVNVALPTIRRDLHASATQLEWVVSGYMLAFAAALIIAGNLGDLFGRKRVFLSGVVVFGLASLAAGLSQSGAELISARVVQGAAAAAMAPQVLATFRAIFAGSERGKAFSIYGAMLGFASAVGLLLGGVLTEANLFGWSWRAVFFVNVPVAAGALIAGLRFVPETRDTGARRPDVPGAVLLAGSLVAIVYPLLEGRTLGWPAWVWALLVAGLAGLGVLGLLEARRGRRRNGGADAPAPLLRAGLFRVPAFAAGLGVQVAFSAGHARVLPGLRAVAAGRRALLAAEGRADRGRVQRRQLHRGARRGAARAEARPQRAGHRRAADGGRDRGRLAGRPARGAERQPVAGHPWPGGVRRRAGPAGHPAGQRGAGGGPGPGGRRGVGAVQHGAAARRRDRAWRCSARCSSGT